MICTFVIGAPGLSVWNGLYMQQTAIKQFSSWRHNNMWSLSDIGCLRDFNICSKWHFSMSNTVFNIFTYTPLYLYRRAWTQTSVFITTLCLPFFCVYFFFLFWPPGGALHLRRMAPTSMPKTCRRWQRCTGWLSAATGRWPSSRWGTKQTSTASASSTRRLWTSPWIPATLKLMILLQVDGWRDGWWGDTLGERETDRQSWEEHRKGAKMNQMSEWDRRMKGGETRMDEDRKTERGKETPRRWWREGEDEREEKLMTGKNRYRRTGNWEGKGRVRHAGRRTETQRRVKSGQLCFSNTKHVVARLLNKIRERGDTCRVEKRQKMTQQISANAGKNENGGGEAAREMDR